MNILQNEYPRSTVSFDLLFIIFSFWLTLGVFIDGWAHNHLPSTLETFLTPWHAIFYSGFLAVVVLFAFNGIKNWKIGHRWPRLLPREYHLTIIGLTIFAFAGISDSVWHVLFGIENDIEALLSPTHILLAFGGAVIMCAPFHALWHRKDEDKPSTFCVIMSLLLFLSLLSFMTQFAHPLHQPWMDVNFATNPMDSGQAIGVASIIIQTVVLMGIVLLLLKKWRFPFFSFTLLLGLNATLMSILQDQYRFILPFFVSGLIIDLIYRFLKPSRMSPKRIRIFATTMPVIIYTNYTITIFLTSGTWWSIHMWAGTILISGIIGYLLSYLVVKPATTET